MAVCYTNDMDDLVLFYERIDCGSLYTYLYQKVQLSLLCALMAIYIVCEYCG